MNKKMVIWPYILADVTFLLLLFFLVTSFPGTRPSSIPPIEEGRGEGIRPEKNLPVDEKASKIDAKKHIEGLLLKIKKVGEDDEEIIGESITFDKIVYFLGEDVISPDSLINIDKPEDAVSQVDTVNGERILRYCDLAEKSLVKKYLKNHIKKLKSAKKYKKFKETNNLKVQIEAEKGIKFGDIYSIMQVCYQETLKTMPFRVLKFETER